MKTTRPQTHIQTQRLTAASEAEQVQSLLSWTHEDYCTIQFKEYCAFVESISEGYPQVQKEILYSPVFRGFWNNEWNRRDRQEFLEHAIDSGLTRDVLETEYFFIHCHEVLLEDDAFMIRYSHILKLI